MHLHPQVDDKSKTFTLGGKTFKSGDWISLNGNTGEVIDGKEPLSPPILAGDLGTFMGWVDEKRKLKVYANADTPEDAAEARRNGAQVTHTHTHTWREGICLYV